MLDVVVLFFLFGLLAALVRSELKHPPALYDILSLFLLEMGLIVARQCQELRRHDLTPLATLAASASYIAVPATLRIALPQANPGLSLSAVQGITFPFNIMLGIPLYHSRARTRLTVITEAILEPTLLHTLTRERLRGYTITDARGRDDHGERNASWRERQYPAGSHLQPRTGGTVAGAPANPLLPRLRHDRLSATGRNRATRKILSRSVGFFCSLQANV